MVLPDEPQDHFAFGVVWMDGAAYQLAVEPFDEAATVYSVLGA